MEFINDVTCDDTRDTRALLASSSTTGSNARTRAHAQALRRTLNCRRLAVAAAIALFMLLLGFAIGYAVFGGTAASASSPGLSTAFPFTYGGPARRAPHVAVLAVPSFTTVGEEWIPGSVVSWLESAGAVVVPVPSGVYWNESGPNFTTSQASTWTPERYAEVFNSVNGLMLPGGDPWPQVSSDAVRQLYALALAANARGDYFPIWGTCAGMETLVALASGGCQARVTNGTIPTGVCAAEGPITRGWDSLNLSSTLQLGPHVR